MQDTKSTSLFAGTEHPLPGDTETKSLLNEINEKLAILIELQQARCPPPEMQEEPKTSDDCEDIDTSWIIPTNWYDNSQFCRIFNVAMPTAQKWRSKRMISYIKIGNRVSYVGSEIIRFIDVYASPRKYVITPIGVNG